MTIEQISQALSAASLLELELDLPRPSVPSAASMGSPGLVNSSDPRDTVQTLEKPLCDSLVFDFSRIESAMFMDGVDIFQPYYVPSDMIVSKHDLTTIAVPPSIYLDPYESKKAVWCGKSNTKCVSNAAEKRLLPIHPQLSLQTRTWEIVWGCLWESSRVGRRWYEPLEEGLQSRQKRHANQ